MPEVNLKNKKTFNCNQIHKIVEQWNLQQIKALERNNNNN